MPSLHAPTRASSKGRMGAFKWALLLCSLLFANSVCAWQVFPNGELKDPSIDAVTEVKAVLASFLKDVPRLQGFSPALDLSHEKAALMTILSEFDYIMHRSGLIVGERPAHANRHVIEDVRKVMDAVPQEEMSVKQTLTDVRDLAALVKRVHDSLQTTMSPLPTLAHLQAAKENVRDVNSLVNTIQSLSSRVYTRSSIGAHLERVRSDYFRRFAPKYTDARDQKKYDDRFHLTITKANKALTVMSERVAPFEAYQVQAKTTLLLFMQKLNTALAKMRNLPAVLQHRIEVVENSKERCLESEAFRLMLLEEELTRTPLVDQAWFDDLLAQARKRQDTLTSFRAQEQQSAQAFHNPVRLSAEEFKIRMSMRKQRLMELSNKFVAGIKSAVGALKLECNRLSDPSSWGEEQLTQALEKLQQEYSLLDGFKAMAGKDFGEWDKEELDSINSALWQLHYGVESLKLTISSFSKMTDAHCLATVSEAVAFLTKLERTWLRSAPALEPEQIARGLRDLRTESLRLLPNLLSPMMSASQLEKIGDPALSAKDLQLQLSTLSGAASKVKAYLAQADKSVNKLGDGIILTTYRSRRAAYGEQHKALYREIRGLLRGFSELDQDMQTARTAVVDFFKAAQVIVEDTPIFSILNPPRPEDIPSHRLASYTPVFTEPPHEAQALLCVRTSFYAALAAATDFAVECTSMMDFSVTSGAIEAKNKESDIRIAGLIESARTGDELTAAFKEYITKAAEIDIKLFKEKAETLSVSTGLFMPINSKLQSFEAARFSPGSFLPRSHPRLVKTFDRRADPTTSVEERLQILLANSEPILRDLVRENGVEMKYRRNPIIVQWYGEQGIDYGGLRAELFSSLANALMDEAAGLVKPADVDGLVLFATPSLAPGNSQKQLFRARLLGFIMGWSFFNRVSISLKLPLVYYDYLRNRIRSIFYTERYLDKDWPNERYMLTELMGSSEFRHSTFATMENYLSPQSVAAEKHMIAVCAAESILPPDVPDRFKETEVIKGFSTSIQDAVDYGAYIKLEEMAMTAALPLVQEWAKSFIGMFSNSELATLAHLRLDEFQTVFGALPDIDVDRLQSVVFWSGVDFPVDERLSRNEQLAQSTAQASRTLTYRAFWNMMRKLPNKQRKLILEFWTGMSSIPTDFTHNKWIIQLNSARQDWRLPVAHTCFYTIELPQCDRSLTVEQCTDKLIQGFGHGFGALGRFDIR